MHMRGRLCCLLIVGVGFGLALGLTARGQGPAKSVAPPSPSNAQKPNGAAGETAKETPKPAPIELKVVKYPDLVKAVKAQKGKILVVDIWAEW